MTEIMDNMNKDNSIVEINVEYVHIYIRSLGYDPSPLGQSELAWVFRLLSRLEEGHHDICDSGWTWDLDLAPYARQAERHRPVLEEAVARWHREGVIAPLPQAPPRWPDGKRFALVLTHDVDHLIAHSLKERGRALQHIGAAPIGRKAVHLLGFLNALAQRARPRSTRWAGIDEWMDVEAKHGFQSSFFFFAQPLPRPHFSDAFYRYSDRADFQGRSRPIGDIIREVADAGWDVGLHGSIHTFSDATLLAQERQIVEAAAGKPVSTIRQHYLKYDAWRTPEAHEAAGFQADCTLGSNVSADYRCGTGLPFLMYGHGRQAPTNVLQVPLVIEDTALIRHQGLSEDLAVAQCVELMTAAAEAESALTLLWHNSFARDSIEFRVYERVLQVASDLGAWGCSVAQMNEWWRSRLEEVRPPATADTGIPQ